MKVEKGHSVDNRLSRVFQQDHLEHQIDVGGNFPITFAFFRAECA
ncbi:MAG: hypothetical protein OXE41_07630 [Gammaproteobacteria bacterium]|nr:hypothetical protein [Gammaproteobacteria bacterium]MCY4275246.1 hypothetical protein [Gammaproteobacteria bacterium]